MKHLRTAWLAPLMALALQLGVGVAHADEESDRLAALGKPHTYTMKTTNPPSPIETGGAATVIDAPIAEVRKVVTNYGAYQKFLKPFDQSRVISKRKGVSEVYLQVPILNGAANIWIVTEIAPPVKQGKDELVVGKFKNGNVEDFRAVWRMRSVSPDKTVLKLELMVDPALPFGASIVTQTLVKSAAKGVAGVKTRAEEAHAKRPGNKKKGSSAAVADTPSEAPEKRPETTEVASQSPADTKAPPSGSSKPKEEAPR
ncbi:SRPBCC family protein [Chondromyces crocatus]|uniref:Coenzyme Q-binding protein COQ10 START domain-containing protein n=1 Tax=Chondromyces crocatus TaxID=52 RepID=A0A0K1ENK5_CHOCO|nr:SRPBCC family protein [Chondromyces crocatus]AKT42178.1 uncharacterized protein CMC5_064010 [Chondromyces crocatus]